MTRAPAAPTRPTGLVPSRRQLFAVWLATAAAVGLLLVLARTKEGPLDDPDPARQRPGFLDLGALPEPAPPVAPGVPARHQPTVVFFVRPDLVEDVCATLEDSALAGRATLAVVVAGAASACPAVDVALDDPDEDLGGRYGLRSPRDGGPPVGYAVVDGRGRTRYRTLDPHVAHGLGEVLTIVKAVE